MSDRYELFYWPDLPGRAEFIRLIFEDAAVPYVDVARMPADQGGGVEAVMAFYQGQQQGHPVFAPPVLRVGGLVLGQMPNICLFVGRRFDRAPADEPGWLLANQLQLTLADLIDEVHETHHPLGMSLYYEEQREAARQRAALFVEQRLPRFLGYFERVLQHNGGEVLVGQGVSYVDLSLFQVLSGLAYAFPRAFAREAAKVPQLVALGRRVAQRPAMVDYLDSPRRIPFNEDGIFRHYPELDR